MEIILNNLSSNKISNLNVIFSENRITSLIGNNDSGVREIFNLIIGLDKIIDGEIKFDKKMLDKASSKKKINEMINQIYYLNENSIKQLFNINIKEDIKFYLDKYDKEKLNKMLKTFNLDNSLLLKNYSELSSSELKKILLIIGLLSTKKIIILDNPTLNLDAKSIQTLVKLLKQFKRENKIIILSSYNTDFLLEVSDNIVVVDNKKIINQGNKFEIFSNEKLMEKVNLKVPDVISFSNAVKEIKNIKIGYRDNINDLLKDIFRYAK